MAEQKVKSAAQKYSRRQVRIPSLSSSKVYSVRPLYFHVNLKSFLKILNAGKSRAVFY